MGAFSLAAYLGSSATTLLVGFAAIASTITRQPARKPFRYAIATVALLVLTWLVPVNTLLYLALACGLLFWAERQAGAVHWLGAAALFISSPAFQYAAGIFSFPIRLQLAKLVASFFSLFSTNVRLKGNVILYQDREFAVDPACMGLHMLSLSLLLGILLAGLLQRKTGRTLSVKTSFVYLACLFLLNLVANVLRIVLLVHFSIPPLTLVHDVVGLLCLLVYVVIPACYLAKFLVKRSAPLPAQASFAKTKNLRFAALLLAAAMFTVTLKVRNTDTYSAFEKNYQQPVASYNSSVYAPGILKLENKTSLLYIKFIRGFYDTEHNPMICWKGSGYELQNVHTQRFAGAEVYMATLQREKEKLFTAWWYGNGRHHTTSQWDWRLRMLKGETGYAVQNVTAGDEKTLKEEVSQLLSAGVLLPLLSQ